MSSEGIRTPLTNFARWRMERFNLNTHDVDFILSNCRVDHSEADNDAFVDHEAVLGTGKTVVVRTSATSVTDVSVARGDL